MSDDTVLDEFSGSLFVTGTSRHRRKEGFCCNGHELKVVGTYWQKDAAMGRAKGTWLCKECRKERRARAK